LIWLNAQIEDFHKLRHGIRRRTGCYENLRAARAGGKCLSPEFRVLLRTRTERRWRQAGDSRNRAGSFGSWAPHGEGPIARRSTNGNALLPGI